MHYIGYLKFDKINRNLFAYESTDILHTDGQRFMENAAIFKEFPHIRYRKKFPAWKKYYYDYNI